MRTPSAVGGPSEEVAGHVVRRKPDGNGGLEVDPDATRSYTYDYNPQGELTAIVDLDPPRPDTGPTPDQRTTSISRDVAGRPRTVNESWASGKDTRYGYLPGGHIDRVQVDGRVLSGSYSGGRTMDYAYDNLDRNIRVEVTGDGSGDGQTTTFSYWPSGERDRMTKANATIERRYYDDQGLLDLRTLQRDGESAPTAEDGERWRQYTYDENANRTSDERGIYDFNARDQLKRWENDGHATAADPTRVVAYEPQGDGRIDTRTETVTISGQSATSTQDYDYRGDRLDTATITTAGQTDEVDYRHSALGSLLAIRTAKPGQSEKLTTQYTYDAFERLLSARDDKNADGDLEDQGESASEVYCYDALDRRDRKVTGVQDIPEQTQADDSFQAQRTACLASDADRVRDYSYLGLTEELTREGTGSSAKTYDYTAAGERLGITARLPGQGDQSRVFRPYETDAQGSTIAVEGSDDEQGGTAPTANERYELDPYGQTLNEDELAGAAKENPFRFQGHYLDPAVGTYDMRARAYRPALGRFLTGDRYQDPTADLTLQQDPLTSDRYAFLAGDPIGRVEIDGHCYGAFSFVREGKVGGAICGVVDTVRDAISVKSRESGITRFVKATGSAVRDVVTRALSGFNGPSAAQRLARQQAIEQVNSTFDGGGLSPRDAIVGCASSQIPFLDTACSLADSAISVVKGDIAGAGLGIAGAFPLIGAPADGARASRRAAHIADEAADTTKGADERFPRLRRFLQDERGGTAGDDGPDLIYEHNPKHGPVSRQGPKGEVSRAPRGDCQAMLDCSTQFGPKLRSGVEPETGLEVLFRRHRVFGDTEWWHGYVPGG